MTLEFKPYEGDGDDLADLIVRTWSRKYSGVVWYPVWDRDYVRWRIMDPQILDRELIVCAYDDGQLQGCIVGEETGLQLRGRRLRGSLVSYLSVDPESRHRGLALRLLAQLREVHKERGIELALGVTNAAPGSQSKAFWDAVQKRYPGELSYLGGYRLWAKVNDAEGVRAAGISAFDRWSSAASSWLPWGWSLLRGSEARAPQEPELDDYALALRGAQAGAQLTMDWSPQRLALQLFGGPSRTYVFGGPTHKGVVSAYLIEWQGVERIRVGFIEFCAVPGGVAASAKALVSAGRTLSRAGAQMIALMDKGALPSSALLAAGLMPRDPQVQAMALFNFEGIDLSDVNSTSVAFT